MSAVPPTPDQMADFYSAMGSLLQMAWGDNFHFGYWEGPGDTSSVEEATDRFTDLLTGRLRVGPGDRVLDVGCGVGKPAVRLASATGATVLGITVSAEQVEQGNERARAAALSERVSFQYADAMDLPFEDGSFDAVLALESIMHMDRPAALREVARVLRPGGRLALTDLIPPAGAAGDAGPGGGTAERPGGIDIASLTHSDDWPGLTADAGLVLDEVTDVSANIEGTFQRMYDAFVQHGEEFERRYGIAMEQVLDSINVASQSAAGPVGCIVVAAHKP
jgi:ubiquinone/menaquinone biosynthesis C-methylase UbiE